jgi:hypothetical protein
MTETILINIINNMNDAQEAITGGLTKKEYVMNKLKEYMDKNDFERYSPMISLTIDFIKYLSSNKDLLNGLKRQKCFSCISI